MGTSSLMCASGGIGRRAGFRFQWGNSWRFKSSLAHQSCNSRTTTPRENYRRGVPDHSRIPLNLPFCCLRRHYRLDYGRSFGPPNTCTGGALNLGVNLQPVPPSLVPITPRRRWRQLISHGAVFGQLKTRLNGSLEVDFGALVWDDGDGHWWSSGGRRRDGLVQLLTCLERRLVWEPGHRFGGAGVAYAWRWRGWRNRAPWWIDPGQRTGRSSWGDPAEQAFGLRVVLWSAPSYVRHILIK